MGYGKGVKNNRLLIDLRGGAVYEREVQCLFQQSETGVKNAGSIFEDERKTGFQKRRRGMWWNHSSLGKKTCCIRIERGYPGRELVVWRK